MINERDEELFSQFLQSSTSTVGFVIGVIVGILITTLQCLVVIVILLKKKRKQSLMVLQDSAAIDNHTYMSVRNSSSQSNSHSEIKTTSLMYVRIMNLIMLYALLKCGSLCLYTGQVVAR